MVARVSFVVDDDVVFTDPSAPFAFDFRIARGTTGLTVGATASDVAGNLGSAVPVTVAVLMR